MGALYSTWPCLAGSLTTTELTVSLSSTSTTMATTSVLRMRSLSGRVQSATTAPM